MPTKIFIGVLGGSELEPISGRQSRQKRNYLLPARLTPPIGLPNCERYIANVEWINPRLDRYEAYVSRADLIAFNSVEAEALQVYFDVTHRDQAQMSVV